MLVMDSQEEKDTLEELLAKVQQTDPEYAKVARGKFRHTLGPYTAGGAAHSASAAETAAKKD